MTDIDHKMKPSFHQFLNFEYNFESYFCRCALLTNLCLGVFLVLGLPQIPGFCLIHSWKLHIIHDKIHDKIHNKIHDKIHDKIQDFTPDKNVQGSPTKLVSLLPPPQLLPQNMSKGLFCFCWGGHFLLRRFISCMNIKQILDFFPQICCRTPPPWILAHWRLVPCPACHKGCWRKNSYCWSTVAL